MRPPRCLPSWSLALASVGVLVAWISAAPDLSCPPAAACATDVASPVVSGLLLGAPLAALLSRPVAAGLAGLLAAYWSFGYVDAPAYRWWASGRRRALRRLVSEPQPVRSLDLVADQARRVAVIDAPDDVWIPVEPDGRIGSIGRADLWRPVAGRWFASEVDDHVRVPLGPAGIHDRPISGLLLSGLLIPGLLWSLRRPIGPTALISVRPLAGGERVHGRPRLVVQSHPALSRIRVAESPPDQRG